MAPAIPTEAMNPEFAELCELERKKGMLRPFDVVEFARDPETALHRRFTWDNKRAAHAHRLWEARQLIRVHVTVVPHAIREMRAFVSLTTDRTNGGGYRPLVKVLNDEDLRGQLLADARRELATFRRKYEELNELAPVFDAIDRIAAKEAVG